ncbi:hypothetical protein MMPV_008730 [Pyropia vietnamensis]
MPRLPPLPVLLTLYWAAATVSFAGLSAHAATAAVLAHGKLAPPPPPRVGRSGSDTGSGSGSGNDSYKDNNGGGSGGTGRVGRTVVAAARWWWRRCWRAGVAARPAWAAFYVTGLVVAAVLLAVPPPPPGLPADVAVAAAVRSVARGFVGGGGAVASATAVAPLSLPLILFVVQTARRLAEVIAVSVQTPRLVPAHLLAGGLSFYVAAPLTWWVGGPAVGTVSHLPAFGGTRWGGGWRLASPATAVVAVVVFVVASVVQHWAHRVLARLRRGSGGGGNGGVVYRYGFPRGGAFEVVTCPHYTAEVVLYVALAVAAAAASGLTGASPGVGGWWADADGDIWVAAARVGCVGFVGVNLGITGRQTVRWYQLRGGKVRWALVPGVL